ncbi:SDR family oxidoreductase [Komagataeibacter rhaeticus]|nr:SDR family oxidoreductase [Komagataeibacter rhaeticus]
MGEAGCPDYRGVERVWRHDRAGARHCRALCLCRYSGPYGQGKAAVEDAARFAADWKVDLRTVELDVLQDTQVGAAVNRIIAEQGQIDVVIHNAGHMCFGPAEAFTPEQLAALYDVNVLSTQRLNRAALPHMRKGAGTGRVGLVIQHAGRHAAFPRPLFRGKGGNGCAGHFLCR